MTAQTKILFNFDFANLQVFFAIVAFVEEHPDATYLTNPKNSELLKEVKRILPIKIQEFTSYKSKEEYNTISIIIDHSKPFTTIEGVKSSSLIFPKLIVKNFYKPEKSKIKKIYFRGLLTKTRLIESLRLFLRLRDFHAIIQLIKSSVFYKRENIINSKQVYFKFTDRGRQANFKYIDSEYYQEMANYQIVFCPKGDFIWTYRFFEAIQVGSIPLCKHYCFAYANYDYLTSPLKDIKTNSISGNNLTLLKNTLNYKRK